MKHSTDMKFEITDSGDLIRVEPLSTMFPEQDSSLSDWDKNWISAKVTIKAGVFSGSFKADFMATDFELLKQDFKKLDKDFNGTANFDPLEGQLILDINGDGLGHFEVNCIANDQPGFGAKISFTLSFDQTELSRLINELELITKAFPTKGNISRSS